MKFNEQFLEDRLRQAEHAEIASSEDQLFGDLRRYLSPENLKTGVEINFGDQKTQFETVLGQLGITDLLWSRSSSVHIHNAIVASGGNTSFLGRSLSQIGNVPLLDTLDALQADHWTTYDEHGRDPRIQPYADVITSKLLVGNSVQVGDGEKHTDTSMLGMLIGVSNRYRPNFNTARRGLPDFVRDNESAHGHEDRDVVSATLAEITVNDKHIEMPQRSYYMKLGRLAGHEYAPAISDVSTEHVLTIVGGRAVKQE